MRIHLEFGVDTTDNKRPQFSMKEGFPHKSCTRHTGDGEKRNLNTDRPAFGGTSRKKEKLLSASEFGPLQVEVMNL